MTSILNDSTMSDEVKQSSIINVLAKDENVLTTIMHVLQKERLYRKDLLLDMNLELSRAHIFIDDYMPEPVKLRKNETGPTFTRNFVLDQIAAFYVKYKDTILHSFNRFK